jgi:hypothetical protein
MCFLLLFDAIHNNMIPRSAIVPRTLQQAWLLRGAEVQVPLGDNQIVMSGKDFGVVSRVSVTSFIYT